MTDKMVENDIIARAGEIRSIEAGINGPEIDRWFWRTKAEARIRALKEDGAIFGLVPHEEAELAHLETLLARTDHGR